MADGEAAAGCRRTRAIVSQARPKNTLHIRVPTPCSDPGDDPSSTGVSARAAALRAERQLLSACSPKCFLRVRRGCRAPDAMQPEEFELLPRLHARDLLQNRVFPFLLASDRGCRCDI